jgi:predicted DsbA family dithiol-disulfide isomerase
VEPVRLIVWSDYLCPWCRLASARMRVLRAEYGEQLEVEYRSFLLRPRPQPGRSLEEFRAYTERWARPAAEPDAPEFRTWHSDAGPPSHSLPPHLAAKAAASLSRDAFQRLHGRLLDAYFVDSRDVTDRAVLRAIWSEAGLADAEFARIDDPAHEKRVIEEHEDALARGAGGVPAVAMHGVDAVLTGAHPLDLYRRWIDRAPERR